MKRRVIRLDRIAELKKLINEWYDDLENGGQDTLDRFVTEIKKHKITANMHVGDNRFKTLEKTSDEYRILALEWYLGSLVEIKEKKGYFAVNSWLNCKERFCDNI